MADRAEAERRRRVTIFLPSLAGGGAERVLLEIARGLVARGFDVDVVVVRDEGELRDSVPAGARLVDLRARRGALAARSLRGYIADARPDAVISGLDPTNALNALVCRLVWPRVPSIVTQHNTVSQVAENAGSRRERIVALVVNRWLFRSASRIVAVSAGVADDMSATLHLDRGAIDVIYNPVISDRVVDAEMVIAHPWLQDKIGPVLLAVGRLVPQKDFPNLVHALSMLPEDHRLIVLGEGPGRDELLTLARNLGVDDRVDVHGFVANPFSVFCRGRCLRSVVAMGGTADGVDRGPAVPVRHRCHRLPERASRNS